jgi:hypothetical protein
LTDEPKDVYECVYARPLSDDQAVGYSDSEPATQADTLLRARSNESGRAVLQLDSHDVVDQRFAIRLAPPFAKRGYSCANSSPQRFDVIDLFEKLSSFAHDGEKYVRCTAIQADPDTSDYLLRLMRCRLSSGRSPGPSLTVGMPGRMPPPSRR